MPNGLSDGGLYVIFVLSSKFIGNREKVIGDYTCHSWFLAMGKTQGVNVISYSLLLIPYYLMWGYSRYARYCLIDRLSSFVVLLIVYIAGG